MPKHNLITTKYILFNPTSGQYVGPDKLLTYNPNKARLYASAGTARGNKTHLLNYYSSEYYDDLRKELSNLEVYSVTICLGELK